MLVKDIIILTCELLDKKDLADKLIAGELEGEESKEISNLENCFNLVHEEISTELLPIVKIEKIKTQNLKVEFSQLSSVPVSILAVKDSCGRAVRHKVLNDGIIAFSNEVEVWYSAKPESATIDSEISSTLPERVYAYGLAREYYIKKSLYKDAEVWEERFKNSIEMLSPKKSGRRVPRRRWL